MINYLDSLYSNILNKHPILTRLRFYSLLRFAVRLWANLLLPIYFKLSVPEKRASTPVPDSHHIIVSLTSFPGRIKGVWKVIECLLRQTRKPDKIILWLAKAQFPRGESDLPPRLLRYCSALFEIRFVEEDFRSHKKYYYAFREFPNSCIVTVDDDLFYVDFMIADLLDLHVRFPKSICCYRAMTVSHMADGTIAPYNDWKKIRTFAGPAQNLFQTSGGGTLYVPAMMLHRELFNHQVFQKICFHADDVWLNVMAQMQGSTTVKSKHYSEFLPIWNRSSIKLSNYNVKDGGNDHQLQAVIKHYRLDPGKIFNSRQATNV